MYSTEVFGANIDKKGNDNDKKAYDTRCSQPVTYPSINQVQRRLFSEIEWERKRKNVLLDLHVSGGTT